MNINSMSQISAEISQKETYIKKGDTEISQKSTTIKLSASESVVYEKNSPTELLTDTGYKVDMEKVLEMKEENEQRMIDLFQQTVKSGTLKQMGGFRGFIASLRGSLDGDKNGSMTISAIASSEAYAAYQETNGEISIEITQEAITSAQADVAEDGYWGAEATSQRFLEFAQALSGGDSSKADLLLDAVKAGYEAAEEIWGSTLPQLSQDTLALTIEKFETWRDGTEAIETSQELE